MNITRNKKTIAVVTVNVECHRRWPAEEMRRWCTKRIEPGMSVWLMAFKHGVGASQLLNWRKLECKGAITTLAAGESLVSASELAAAWTVNSMAQGEGGILLMNEATADYLYNAQITATDIGCRTDGKDMLKIFVTYIRRMNDSRNQTNWQTAIRCSCELLPQSRNCSIF